MLLLSLNNDYLIINFAIGILVLNYLKELPNIYVNIFCRILNIDHIDIQKTAYVEAEIQNSEINWRLYSGIS